MKTEQYDSLVVHVFDTRAEMGARASADIIAAIKGRLERQQTVRVIFAAAPSQLEVLEALKDSDLDWSRIEAYHMDEYIGLPADSPKRFANFLRRHLFDFVRPCRVRFMEFDEDNLERDMAAYGADLESAPIDIVCFGVGENGHLAFNDPPNADFDDPRSIKIVELDEACKAQQVNDGGFDCIDDIPKNAVTLTIPTLLKAEEQFCVVPGKNKHAAVWNALNGEVHASCPATVLRRKKGCTMYLDEDSYTG